MHGFLNTCNMAHCSPWQAEVPFESFIYVACVYACVRPMVQICLDQNLDVYEWITKVFVLLYQKVNFPYLGLKCRCTLLWALMILTIEKSAEQN